MANEQRENRRCDPRSTPASPTPECDEVAKACRNRARVCFDGDVEEFYALLLEAM